MSEEAKGKGTTLFGRVIHSADEWKAIEDEMAETRKQLAVRTRELRGLEGKSEAMEKRLLDAERALEEERARFIRAEHDFEAKLEEAQTQLTEGEKSTASVRESDAQLAQAAVAREKKRADAAEARAREFESKLGELVEETATISRTLATKTVALESMTRDRDALRDELNASTVRASSTDEAAKLLERARDSLREQIAGLEKDKAEASRRAEGETARQAAFAAVARRLMGGVGTLLPLVFGNGSRTAWAWCTSESAGGQLSLEEFGQVLHGFGIGTDAVLEVDEKAAVLRYTASDDPPGWVLELAEAVLQHHAGRTYAATPPSQEDGRVTVRFEALEN